MQEYKEARRAMLGVFVKAWLGCETASAESQKVCRVWRHAKAALANLMLRSWGVL